MKLLISNYHIKNRNLSFPVLALLQHPVHSLTWLRPKGVQPAQVAIYRVNSGQNCSFVHTSLYLSN